LRRASGASLALLEEEKKEAALEVSRDFERRSGVGR